MKICPKCGESNGTNAPSCFKCGCVLPAELGYMKICPKCRATYHARATTCENCHVPLAVYSDQSTACASTGEKWPYVIAVFVPLVGIILGLIFIAQRRPDGPSVLITGIVGPIALGILLTLLSMLFSFI